MDTQTYDIIILATCGLIVIYALIQFYKGLFQSSKMRKSLRKPYQQFYNDLWR